MVRTARILGGPHARIDPHRTVDASMQACNTYPTLGTPSCLHFLLGAQGVVMATARVEHPDDGSITVASR